MNEVPNIMNESINKDVIYDMEEATKILERVEQFNPKSQLRKIESEGGVRYYLDTKDRIVWFRKTFPLGKVCKILKECTEEYATFEVRVYMHKDDHCDNYLANGFATRRKDVSNPEFGMNFLEAAETAALGRALKDAGFGTQSCGMEIQGEIDEQIVDAGVHISFDLGDGTLPNPDEDGAPVEEGVGTEAGKTTGTEEKTATVTKPEEKPKEEKVVLTADMPVEELLKKMTVDFAKEIVIDYGIDKGKTLGKLAQERPQGVQYHASKAKNNLIRAGAMFLLEQAKVA